MESYKPEQPNTPPVEQLSDEELLALREQCSRELGRRVMSSTESSAAKTTPKDVKGPLAKKLASRGLGRVRYVPSAESPRPPSLKKDVSRHRAAGASI